MKRSLALSQTLYKPITHNQTYGAFDMRSPVFSHRPLFQSGTPKSKPTTVHKRQSSQIQYSDLTNIPPKHYDPKPLKKYQNSQKPLYRNDKVVNDDYHRVMREYRTIEEQEVTKKPVNYVSKVKQVSLKPPTEKQKKNADPLKLKKEELPDQILEQIEKLIRLKLQKITPDIMQSLKAEQNQRRGNDKVIKEEKNEGSDRAEENIEEEAEDTIEKFDPVSQWQVKKEIESKLRKELQKEALGLLKMQKQQQQELKDKYEEEKRKRMEDWERQKEQEKKMQQKIKKLVKKQEKIEKENKKRQSKQAFQEWMQGHCEKLREQQIKEQQRKEIQMKDLQIQYRLIHLKRKMCDQAYNDWKRRKEEEEKEQKMTAQERAEELDRDEDVDYNTNFKEFVDSLVNDNHPKAQTQQIGEYDIYNTPQQTKMSKLDQVTGSKKSKKNMGQSEKRKKGKKITKKFVMNQEEEKYAGDIERISEKKSSSEQSYEGKKEYQELSSIQKNNASQPVVGDSVESIVSGMEGQERAGGKK